MNKYSQLKLISFFRQLIEYEQILHSYKLQLVNNNIVPYTNFNFLFDQISASKNQCITLQQFRKYLLNKIKFSQKDLYQLFARFDWSRTGQISRSDFNKCLLPNENLVSIMKSSNQYSQDIEDKFLRFLIIIIEKFRILEVCRKELSEIIIYQIFEEIDVNLCGYLGKFQLITFFKNNEDSITEPQINFLIFALTKNHLYPRITMQVLNETINPYESIHHENFKKQLKQITQKHNKELQKIQEQKIREKRIEAHNTLNENQKKQRRAIAQMQKIKQQQNQIEQNAQKFQEQKFRSQRKLELEYEKSIRKPPPSQEVVVKKEKLNQLVSKQNTNYINYNNKRGTADYQSLKKKYPNYIKYQNDQLNDLTVRKKKNYQSIPLFYPSNHILEQQRYLQQKLMKEKQKEQDEKMRNQQRQRYLQYQRDCLRRQIRFERIQNQPHKLKHFEYPNLTQRIRNSKEQQERELIQQDLNQKKRKFELKKQLQKTRMELQVRKTKIQMETKFNKDYQSLKRINFLY